MLIVHTTALIYGAGWGPVDKLLLVLGNKYRRMSINRAMGQWVDSGLRASVTDNIIGYFVEARYSTCLNEDEMSMGPKRVFSAGWRTLLINKDFPGTWIFCTRSWQ